MASPRLTRFGVLVVLLGWALLLGGGRGNFLDGRVRAHDPGDGAFIGDGQGCIAERDGLHDELLRV